MSFVASRHLSVSYDNFCCATSNFQMLWVVRISKATWLDLSISKILHSGFAAVMSEYLNIKPQFSNDDVFVIVNYYSH
jgi:hypothetical protein